MSVLGRSIYVGVAGQNPHRMCMLTNKRFLAVCGVERKPSRIQSSAQHRGMDDEAPLVGAFARVFLQGRPHGGSDGRAPFRQL